MWRADDGDKRLPDVARQVLQVVANQIEQIETAVTALGAAAAGLATRPNTVRVQTGLRAVRLLSKALSPSIRFDGFTLRTRRSATGQSCASPVVNRMAIRRPLTSASA